MDSVKILDCTLRDGGYVNDWKFGLESKKTIIKGLDSSNVDIIECGFISSKKDAGADKTIYSDLRSPLEDLPASGRALFVCMINYGEYLIENVPIHKKGETIDGIRVAFHKKDVDGALKFSKELQKKGYHVFIQPMVTQSYSDGELLSLISEVNSFNPYALYIVDSFGTMRKKDVLRLFYLIDNNLKPTIGVGFHSHNNLQLSFSNTQELLSCNIDRELIIDSSILGMGRGAGNLCTELLAHYLNENHIGTYDLIHILNIVDSEVAPLQSKYQWGYSIPYYIAAVNGCHPNYAMYLSGKQTLSVKDINDIITTLNPKERVLYDEKYIEKRYLEFQNNCVDDYESCKLIKNMISERSILIIAPGNTINVQKDKIKDFIKECDPFIFSINFIPEDYDVDLAFVSNSRRYSNLCDKISKEKIVYTSNIPAIDGSIIVNYSSYLCDNQDVVDNSGLMLINLLRSLNTSKVFLAGFDGFYLERNNNYYSEDITNSADSEQLIRVNKAIASQLKKLKSKIELQLITESSYNV